MNFLTQFEWFNALKWPKNFNVGFFGFGPKDNYWDGYFFWISTKSLFFSLPTLLYIG